MDDCRADAIEELCGGREESTMVEGEGKEREPQGLTH